MKRHQKSISSDEEDLRQSKELKPNDDDRNETIVIKSTFNDLCIDILYELFEYLNANQLYETFYDLTSNVKSIIQNYSLPLHVDISTEKAFRTFSAYIQPTFNHYPKQFISLSLSSYIIDMTPFLSITTLILSQMYLKETQTGHPFRTLCENIFSLTPQDV
ncbi:unnamed protein product [Didymodactylos carnosus]|uniref:Uncharacterized protein n=1 Tax=Didymodactylos carnosus TaxID=1234261 RepID=A0A814KW02_9BILA|nr:unnamed protein product [Didymodactylos carnosus]CAF3825724.1 unnamed protein product [Didymodactylos carnosus]